MAHFRVLERLWNAFQSVHVTFVVAHGPFQSAGVAVESISECLECMPQGLALVSRFPAKICPGGFWCPPILEI